MLKELGNDGHMKWDCPGCKSENTAHVNDAGVQYTDTFGTCALPMCVCGTQTFLKTVFTAEDLQGYNMREPVFEASDALVPNIVGWNHTSSHAAALRHQDLATQMQAAGKVYVAPLS